MGRMFSNEMAGARCLCHGERLASTGSVRSKTNRQWRDDMEAGEHDLGERPYATDVHSLTEPGGLCADWPAVGSGDGAWDYDQQYEPFWRFMVTIPPAARKPHLCG